MTSTETKAAKVRRAFRAGRPEIKSREYDIESAVMTARSLFMEIRKERSLEGIDDWWDDIAVALVLMTTEEARKDRVYLLPISRDFDDLASLYKSAMQLKTTEKVVALGVAFWQLDREAGGETHVWTEQWLAGPRAALAINRASEAFKESGGKETSANFGEQEKA